eukprot:gnl/TRDRNA2_/TRDRNA2_80803_c0_seq1.p1 gnl/TRDRNA2_/TRDRNA2_80803_c0~~gnl/TRDRNA2_/TRDRNA2_80803_c0_seq1.p1  ORF type:complete len:314 (+),score=54.27 gnl/TRDRNA2_/TRDRNA2_80803_c0_seq1:146-1087(+)
MAAFAKPLLEEAVPCGWPRAGKRILVLAVVISLVSTVLWSLMPYADEEDRQQLPFINMLSLLSSSQQLKGSRHHVVSFANKQRTWKGSGSTVQHFDPIWHHEQQRMPFFARAPVVGLGRSNTIARATEIRTELEDMKAFGDRILVKVGAAETRTKGGLFLPTENKRSVGTVMTVGKRTKALKPGDSVMYPKLAGTEMKFNNDVMGMLLKEDDVIGKVPTVDDDDVADMQPMGDRVLVKRKEAASETESGIILPTVAQKKLFVGTVVGAGPDTNAKEGDEILYNKDYGTEVESAKDGSTYMIIKDARILATLAK